MIFQVEIPDDQLERLRPVIADYQEINPEDLSFEDMVVECFYMATDPRGYHDDVDLREIVKVKRLD
jgi:hypothetical protein